jgi:hypothetical protein
MVVISLQSSDLRANFFPVMLTCLSVSGNVAGADCDLFADLEATFQDRATGNTASHRLGILTRLVNIE